MSLQDDMESPTSTQGSAFPWILEHLLAHPGSYEIPLRTMYTLNSNPRAQPFPSTNVASAHPASRPPTIASSIASSPAGPNTSEDCSHPNSTAAARFKANLMSHIAQLPSQPCSLSPSFVTSFVRRCFPAALEHVDFPQALTALDYLKDLEARRRKEVASALKRLGVADAGVKEREALGKTYPGVLKWLTAMEDKERKVESLYTHVYLGLRRWVGRGLYSLPMLLIDN